MQENNNFTPYPARLRSDGYAAITDGTSAPCFFGGNQGWWKPDRFAGNGCGAIAACDVLVYLSQHHSMSMLVPQIKSLPAAFSDYRAFVDFFRLNYAYKKSKNLIGLPIPRLVACLNSYLSDVGCEGISFKNASGRLRNAERIICTSLSADLPVILKVGFNLETLGYKIYYPHTDVFCDHTAVKRMGWHYVVITEIAPDNGDCILTFSSWSGKGTMSLNELRKNMGFKGGLIYIDSAMQLHANGRQT